MRIPLIAGNWKMYKKIADAADLVRGIQILVPSPGAVDVVVAPPFSALAPVIALCRDSYIGVAAQDMYWEDEGAFTGEVSGAMLKDMGCEFAIIGHSERRQLFGETDQTVSKKVAAAMRNGLIPIMCVGETLSQREGGETFQTVERQLGSGLPALASDAVAGVVIAYEPVWAIGTGKNATPEQAEEVHAFIRSFLAQMFDQGVADRVRILYGGSVKPDNAAQLLKMPDIDGALIGGASLKAADFATIIRAASA